MHAPEGLCPDLLSQLFEGRVKACIWRWSASEIVHHGGRSVACLGHVARDRAGVVGLAVYMTQNGRRGAIASMSTGIV